MCSKVVDNLIFYYYHFGGCLYVVANAVLFSFTCVKRMKFWCNRSTQHLANMDDEMITLNNVMSVELAIQREFEYRTKMEQLDFQHLDLLKPLVPLQVKYIYNS